MRVKSFSLFNSFMTAAKDVEIDFISLVGNIRTLLDVYFMPTVLIGVLVETIARNSDKRTSFLIRYPLHIVSELSESNKILCFSS